MSNRARIYLGALLALGGTYGITACGGDDDTPVVVIPDDPTLAITAIQPVGGTRWEPGSSSCVEVGRDPKQTIAVLAATNYKLRPPGTCGSLSLCGRLRLRLDPNGDTEAFRIEAASSTLEVPFEGLELGTHTFRVELLGPSGKEVTDKNEDSATYKSPLVTEVTLDVTAPGDCIGVTDGGDAGSDAETDASEDAGDAGSDANEAGTDAESDATDAETDASEGGSNDAATDAPNDTAASG